MELAGIFECYPMLGIEPQGLLEVYLGHTRELVMQIGLTHEAVVMAIVRLELNGILEFLDSCGQVLGLEVFLGPLVVAFGIGGSR